MVDSEIILGLLRLLIVIVKRDLFTDIFLCVAHRVQLGIFLLQQQGCYILHFHPLTLSQSGLFFRIFSILRNFVSQLLKACSGSKL